MQTSHSKGYKVVYIDHQWIYVDTGEVFDPNNLRLCKKCGRVGPKGHDACLGEIPDAIGACCGHGAQGYVIMKDSPEIWQRLT